MAVIATPGALASSNSRAPRFPRQCLAVTPSDTDTFAFPVTIYVGVAGDVAIIPAGGPATPVVFKNLPAGSLVPVEVSQVRSTATTATNLVAIY